MNKILFFILIVLLCMPFANAKSYKYDEKNLKVIEIDDEKDTNKNKIYQVSQYINESIIENKNNEHISVLYMLRGSLYKQDKDYINALKDYNEALKYSPNQIIILKNLRDLHIDMEDYDKALNLANNIIKLEPKLVDNFMSRAKIYFYLSEYKKAIADYTNAIILNPKNPEAFELRGEIELLLGIKEKGFLDLKYAKEQYYQLEMYDKYHHLTKFINELKSPKYTVHSNLQTNYNLNTSTFYNNNDKELEKIKQSLDDISRQMLFNSVNDTHFINIFP